MKKMIIVLLAGFVALTLLLPIISDASSKKGQFVKASAYKKSDKYEIKIEDNTVKIETKNGKPLKGIVIMADWPWLPVYQFEKNRKYFISGASYPGMKSNAGYGIQIKIKEN